MRHRTHKISFKDGQDANSMLMRKLMSNFLRSSKIVTTLAKARALKQMVEKDMTKAKEKTEANKNYLLKNYADKKIMKVLFEQVGPALKSIQGGYVRIVKLEQRANDGATKARLEWAHPVVLNWDFDKKPKKVSKKAASAKSEPKTKVKTEKVAPKTK